VGGATSAADLVIRHTYALPTHGAPALPDARVVVADGRVVALEPDRDGDPVAARRVVDGRGTVCLPGLVNCHCHVAMTLLRGHGADLPLRRWLEEAIWPVEARLTDEDVHAGALLGCLEMLRGGVTAFADMYDHMDAVAEAVLATGIRASLARGVIGLRPGWERALAEAEALCRRFPPGCDGTVQSMLAPHAEYTCPRPVWEETLALARRLGVAIHTHVSETAEEVEGCRRRHGVSPVRFLAELGAFEVGLLAAHCVHVDADDLGLLGHPGVAVSHNPVSNAKLGSGVAPLEAMRARGIRVGLGTDGAASTDVLSLWEELRAAAWLQKAVRQDPEAAPARALLAMATHVGAEALRLPAGCGRLQVGAPADLVLVRLHGLRQTPCLDPAAAVVYGTADDDVVLTVVAGRVVMEDGAFPGIDHERVRADVAARARRLLGGP
jgi:5-methylthioadenosine/S-adenosylhomocysteine deaminase